MAMESAREAAHAVSEFFQGNPFGTRVGQQIGKWSFFTRLVWEDSGGLTESKSRFWFLFIVIKAALLTSVVAYTLNSNTYILLYSEALIEYLVSWKLLSIPDYWQWDEVTPIFPRFPSS